MLKTVKVLCFMSPCLSLSAVAGPFDTGEQRDGYKLTRSPPIAELMSGAIRQADGSVLIPAGSHSREANRYHAALCEAYGGVDITDLGDVRFSGTSGDGFSCEFSDPQARRGFLAEQQPSFATEIYKDSKGRLLRWVPATPISTPVPSRSDQDAEQQTRAPSRGSSASLIIEPHAAQGTALKGLIYHPLSFVDYYNIPQEAEFSVDSIVYEINPCQWTQSGLVKPTPYRSVGLFVACIAGRDQAARSRITGCYGPACNTDEQWVFHQDP